MFKHFSFKVPRYLKSFSIQKSYASSPETFEIEDLLPYVLQYWIAVHSMRASFVYNTRISFPVKGVLCKLGSCPFPLRKCSKGVTQLSCTMWKVKSSTAHAAEYHIRSSKQNFESYLHVHVHVCLYVCWGFYTRMTKRPEPPARVYFHYCAYVILKLE